MTVTIRSLLQRWEASTRLVVRGADETAPAIDVPVAWVHSSELPDPTPFLDPGHLLLTDGSQFPRRSRDRDRYESYVARLAEHGIVGLGFGTSLIHRQLPPPLEAACRRHGLPMPEVNVRVGTRLVDFLWRDQHLIVETDGYRYHRGRAAFEDDRARDLELHALGFEVIRLSYRQVAQEPRQIASVLRGALGPIPVEASA